MVLYRRGFLESSRIDEIRSEKNFNFAKNTFYGLGGSAKIAYYPQTYGETCALFDYLKKSGERFTVLGCGSNILASDKGYDGAVICTSSLKQIKKCGNTLRAGAGVNVSELLRFCEENGAGGLEYLAGIPASVGGLVYMNGASCGKAISENVLSVTIYDGKLRRLCENECNFGNKHSTMRDINCVVLEAELQVYNETSEKIVEKISECLKARKNQPKGRSCGCVFKNPSGVSAGKIIDSCGLKGARFGGAYVSPVHANFIMNDGASASDVYGLISYIKREVRRKTCIDLEEEIVYIGDF